MRYGVAVVALIVACARPMPPSGGGEDREAPRVVSTTPAHESVVSTVAEEVVFEFDETLSERGMTDVVLISPETGAVDVDRDGNKLKIKVEGGWKPNTIYRVVVAPTIQDRHGNVRKEPAEIVFSTGPALTPTAIAGTIIDRITGRPAPNVRVVATGVRDSVAHVTFSDSAGFFGLRFLPVGRYTLQAYEDANRNKKLDFREKQAEQAVNIGTVRDTAILELNILARDTVPARLLRAEARDSVEVRLTFDDYLDPDQPGEQVTARLFVLPDSSPGPSGRVWRVRDWERAKSAADSVRRAQADTTARRPVTEVRPQPVRPPGADADTARVVPTQELVFVAATPLAPRTRYRIVLGNVRNIAGVANGGGAAVFATRAPPRTDSTTVKRDTIGTPGRFR